MSETRFTDQKDASRYTPADLAMIQPQGQALLHVLVESRRFRMVLHPVEVGAHAQRRHLPQRTAILMLSHLQNVAKCAKRCQILF